MTSAHRNTALFLGAGASAPFDKPTTKRLREILQEKYSKHAPKDTVYSLLNSLLASSHCEDIEEIFQVVRDIQSFQTTYGGKFIFDQEQHGRYHTPQWDMPLLRVGEEISKIAHILEGDI
jgi:hypothetical protein